MRSYNNLHPQRFRDSCTSDHQTTKHYAILLHSPLPNTKILPDLPYANTPTPPPIGIESNDHSTVQCSGVIVGRLGRRRRRRRRRRRFLAKFLDDLVVQPPVVVVVLRSAESLRPPSAVVRRLRDRHGDGGPRPDVGRLQHQRHQQHDRDQRQPRRDDAHRELCTPVHGTRRHRPASAPPRPPPIPAAAAAPPTTTKVIVSSHRFGVVGGRLMITLS